MSKLSDELALPAYAGLSDADASTLINAETIPSLQPIQSFNIRRYLMLSGVWLDFKKSADNAAEIARDALGEFEQFDIKAPLVLSVLTTILDGLVADTTITSFNSVDKIAILGMGDTLISRAQELKIRVDTSDIQRIRGRV